ncbi:unnamed protein product [Pleuronectes platessa]|uniref:Uncharacterized protein n=1 Tax=Pleuronectes platessa TaxID=8262 RepID=A0A9N7ZDG6_PLEPL|nr:unnamed protein product [Pleuronectes platessa]
MLQREQRTTTTVVLGDNPPYLLSHRGTREGLSEVCQGEADTAPPHLFLPAPGGETLTEELEAVEDEVGRQPDAASVVREPGTLPLREVVSENGFTLAAKASFGFSTFDECYKPREEETRRRRGKKGYTAPSDEWAPTSGQKGSRTNTLSVLQVR